MKQMVLSTIAVLSICFGFATQTEFPIQPEESQVCFQTCDPAEELPSGELPPVLEKCRKKKN